MEKTNKPGLNFNSQTGEGFTLLWESPNWGDFEAKCTRGVSFSFPFQTETGQAVLDFRYMGRVLEGRLHFTVFHQNAPVGTLEVFDGVRPVVGHTFPPRRAW